MGHSGTLNTLEAGIILPNALPSQVATVPLVPGGGYYLPSTVIPDQWLQHHYLTGVTGDMRLVLHCLRSLTVRPVGHYEKWEIARPGYLSLQCNKGSSPLQRATWVTG